MRKILFPLLILSILCFMSNCDENPKDQVVIIIFQTDGATNIPGQNVPFSSTISVEPPEKAGWSFKGWYLDQEFTQPFDLEISIETQCSYSSSITLYAKFLEKLYKVIYDGNGNTEGEVPVDDNLYAEGDIIQVKWNYQLRGMKDLPFRGWSLFVDPDFDWDLVFSYYHTIYIYPELGLVFFDSNGKIIIHDTDIELVATFDKSQFPY